MPEETATVKDPDQTGVAAVRIPTVRVKRAFGWKRPQQLRTKTPLLGRPSSHARKRINHAMTAAATTVSVGHAS
ncbi:MAG: hypothetical protein BWY82_00885 [Verrucomicrobia bacterium ADurb.Bin474]|nr:MAG: hypothetical protein BWY82_00885 [Verrucomicrobia bacterium ADurb.Bin474]